MNNRACESDVFRTKGVQVASRTAEQKIRDGQEQGLRNDAVLNALRNQTQINQGILKELAQIRQVLEMNNGALLDEEVWLPFSTTLAPSEQQVVSAVVEQDTAFYYQGLGVTEDAGTQYQEFIDGESAGIFYSPPSTESDSANQYGSKGKRVLRRVDLVITNLNASLSVTYDGFFKGRFRKGGR